MIAPRIAIRHQVVLRQQPGSALGDDVLCAERRSPKVGTLTTPARLAIEATRRCLSGVAHTPDDLIGLSLGTLCGANDVVERSLRTAHGSGIAEVSASWYATGLPNSTAGVVASIAALRGPNLTLLGYHAGLDAIIMACRLLRSGAASSMLAGGFDVPNQSEIARLTQSPELGNTATLTAGIGLLLLTSRTDAAIEPAHIVGWSYGRSERAERDDLVARAIAARAPPLRPSAPILHLISPGDREADHLAASAPIRIAELLAQPEPSHGLHAFVAAGPGLRPVCLAVEITGGGAELSGGWS
jgi:hypothetical protein